MIAREEWVAKQLQFYSVLGKGDYVIVKCDSGVRLPNAVPKTLRSFREMDKSEFVTGRYESHGTLMKAVAGNEEVMAWTQKRSWTHEKTKISQQYLMVGSWSIKNDKRSELALVLHKAYQSIKAPTRGILPSAPRGGPGTKSGFPVRIIAQEGN